MTEYFGPEPTGPYAPRRGVESAGASDIQSRLTNSARALALGALLSGRKTALTGIGGDLELLGVPLGIAAPGGWAGRNEVLSASDFVLDLVGVLDDVTESEASQRTPFLGRSVVPRFSTARVALWQRIEQATRPSSAEAYAWLRLLMAEEDPLLVASASSALSHWRKPREDERAIPRTFLIARDRLRYSIDDADELVSAIAQATLGEMPSRIRESWQPTRPRGRQGENISLIIHGTFAWPERWWFPGGDFHEFVRNNVRSNVYSEGDCFSWSGRYKSRDRRVGAERLTYWLEAKGNPRLDTVFAHSYGGAVALQSTMRGVSMDTLVLLSVPVHDYEVEWRYIHRAVSLRIHCDLVLLAARAKQRFTANVEENLLDSWFVRHDMSHSSTIWASRDLATTMGL
jgi:hypothetical protein